MPLLILAYDDDIDSYSGAITQGAAAYLVKPVSDDELTDAARSSATGSATRTAPRSAGACAGRCS